MNFDKNIILLRLQLAAALVVGLGAACYIGTAIGNHEFVFVTTLIGLSIGGGLLLWMGRYYWIIIPFAMMSDLPAVPIGGRLLSLAELSMAACMLIFLLRLALRREKVHLDPIVFFVLCGFLWVVSIYILNPVGFAFLGSSTVGARDYQKIMLGVFSFLVISNQTVDSRIAGWLIIAWIIAPIISAIYAALGFYYFDVGSELIADPLEGEYTWHQAIGFPAYCIIIWLFSKYPPSQVFSPVTLGRSAIYLLCVTVVLFSGKRAALVVGMLTPLLSALLRREWMHLVAFLVLGASTLVFLVAAHGRIVELPFRVQRSLANLPGDWDSSIKDLTEGAGDSFRDTMRELAWARIHANPVVGKGIGIRPEDFGGINTENFASKDLQMNLALGSSWHSTWLGLWADFGLPSVLFHAAVVVLILVMAMRNFRNTPRSSNLGILSMILLLTVIFGTLRSYTSGSSNVAMDVYWQFGLIAAIAGSIAANKTCVVVPQRNRSVAKAEHGHQ